MNITTVAQPETQLGNEIDGLLNEDTVYSRIVLVSAFVALRTVLRLRERLLGKTADGSRLHFTVGIDLGGTSREVLEELLRWGCETFVFHNTIPRSTFHPKVYLFEGATRATLFVGSNNLTDGGFYTNYEAATRYDFELPADAGEYQRLLGPLGPFLDPQGAPVQRLDAALIATLVARGELPAEAEARRIHWEKACGGNSYDQCPISHHWCRNRSSKGNRLPVKTTTGYSKLDKFPSLARTSRLIPTLGDALSVY